MFWAGSANHAAEQSDWHRCESQRCTRLIYKRKCFSNDRSYSCGARARVAVHFTFRLRACAKSKAAQSQQQHQEKWKLSVSSLSFLQIFPPSKGTGNASMTKTHPIQIVMHLTLSQRITHIIGIGICALEMSLRKCFPRFVVWQLRAERVFKIGRVRIFGTQICQTDVVPLDQHILTHAVPIYLVPVKDLDTSTLTAFLFAASEAGVLSSLIFSGSNR